MKQNQKIIAAICLLLLIPCFIIPVSANSRAQEWFGVDSNGVMVLGENVPIEVTSELLTFDIPTLPYASYRDAETFIAYDSKVTAQYTFHNPTDMTVTATLLFPFGKYPEYAKVSDGTHSINSDIYLDKYGVKINGKEIETKVRHTLSNFQDNGYFDVDKEIIKISNDYMSNGDLTPDSPVIRYSYTVSGINYDTLQNSDSSLVIKYYGSPSDLYFIRDNLISDFSGSGIELSASLKSNYQEVVFYTIGKPIDESELQAEAISCFTGSNSTYPIIGKIDADIALRTTEMTLKDYILAEYSEEDKVSMVDWYNTVINNIEIIQPNGYQKVVKIDTALKYYSLDRWFEYEITLAPGECITNTVTAPLYPEIEAWDRPIKYNYTYYLSPASTWANFGELEILVNTPHYMTVSSVNGFEKTDNGYRLIRQGLPTNEFGTLDLTFTIEASDDIALNQPAGDIFTSIFEWIGNLLLGIFIVIMWIFGHLFA